jgi:peroxiredoxin
VASASISEHFFITMHMNLRFPLALRWLMGAAIVLGSATVGSAAVPSSPAPDFTLRTAEGRNLRLQEQRGQVVMVNFWATWCVPCRAEVPHLNKLYDKYRSSGFVLLGVNVDDNSDTAVNTAAKWGVKFPVLLDAEKKVSRLYDLSSMPSTVLIDRDGKVRYLHRGYRDGYEDTYEKQLRELLKE